MVHQFVLNGGNPVTGVPNNNWWGIRPVHCREAVALYLNIGYMCTLEKFQQRVSTFQGTFLTITGIQLTHQRLYPNWKTFPDSTSDLYIVAMVYQD